MERTKAGQTKATRRKLEQVARELFAERAFADVSADELVAKADVTRGALYHHYAGKEGLFEAVVEATMQDVHRRLVDATAGSDDALQSLQLGIAAFLDACTEPTIQHMLLVEAPAVLGWAKWREFDSKYGFGLLKQALASAANDGLLQRRDIDEMAHFLFGAITEMAMVVARSPDPQKSRDGARRIIESVIEGWRPSG